MSWEYVVVRRAEGLACEVFDGFLFEAAVVAFDEVREAEVAVDLGLQQRVERFGQDFHLALDEAFLHDPFALFLEHLFLRRSELEELADQVVHSA